MKTLINRFEDWFYGNDIKGDAGQWYIIMLGRRMKMTAVIGFVLYVGFILIKVF